MLDEVLGGGFPCRSITEVVGPAGAGKCSSSRGHEEEAEEEEEDVNNVKRDHSSMFELIMTI